MRHSLSTALPVYENLQSLQRTPKTAFLFRQKKKSIELQQIAKQHSYKECATGCHFTGPIALRHSLSVILLNIQFAVSFSGAFRKLILRGKCSAFQHSAFHSCSIARPVIPVNRKPSEIADFFHILSQSVSPLPFANKKERAALRYRPLSMFKTPQITEQPWLPRSA